MKLIEKSELEKLELDIKRTGVKLIYESEIVKKFIISIRRYVNYVGFAEGAKKLNVSQSMLSRIVNSNRLPKLETLNKIMNAISEMNK